jgi:nitroreductase
MVRAIPLDRKNLIAAGRISPMKNAPLTAEAPNKNVISVLEAIRIRRSIRDYKSDPIPPEVLERVTDALRLAPSACNNQPWRFVLVTEPELRQKVAKACNNQMFIAPAPVIVAGCAWPARAYPRMGGSWNSAEIDVAIALDHLTLAASAEGLGTCWIGAFNEQEIKALLHIPAEAKLVALTPLGWPARADMLRPARPADRKAREEILAINRF